MFEHSKSIYHKSNSGLGGKVQYALVDENGSLAGKFWIDELTGALILQQALDWEEQSVYNLTVIAKDQDLHNQLSGVAQVRITVLDVNDNPPQFTQSFYETKVSEMEAEGYELLKVLAFSKDSEENARVRYYLVAPDEAVDVFEIDEHSGG